MLALSIRQPWAWLIVNGHKDIENRSWLTHYRGPILIHAGKESDEAFDWLWAGALCPSVIPRLEDLETGGIIGAAEIVDCVQRSPSPWFFGKHGFVMKNAHPLPFFPCRGKLGLFDVDYPEVLFNGR